MPATRIIIEAFDEAELTRKQVEKEQRMRIQMGAIRSWIEETNSQWLLKSEFNVHGDNAVDDPD